MGLLFSIRKPKIQYHSPTFIIPPHPSGYQVFNVPRFAFEGKFQTPSLYRKLFNSRVVGIPQALDVDMGRVNPNHMVVADTPYFGRTEFTGHGWSGTCSVTVG